jgi:hypothetical protein
MGSLPSIFADWDHACPEYEWEIRHVDPFYGYECICGRPTGGCCAVRVDVVERRTIEIPPKQVFLGLLEPSGPDTP